MDVWWSTQPTGSTLHHPSIEPRRRRGESWQQGVRPNKQRSIDYAEINGMAISASSMPSPCQRDTRSLRIIHARSTVAAG